MKQVLSTLVAVICVFVLAVTNGRTDGCKFGCSKGGHGKCVCAYSQTSQADQEEGKRNPAQIRREMELGESGEVKVGFGQ